MQYCFNAKKTAGLPRRQRIANGHDLRFVLAFSRLGIFTLTIFAWLLGLSSADAQTNKTWSGPSGGDWFNATNWTPAGIPATNDFIYVTNNATINLSAPVTISGQFNWSSGGLTGDALTIATNGTLNIAGDVQLYVALTNQGTAYWQLGEIDLYNNGTSSLGTIWNQPGAVLDIQCDQLMRGLLGGERIQNAGTVLKSVGTATTSLILQLLNSGSGTVTVLQGTFSLLAGGPMDGNFSASAGAAIQFSGSLSYTNPPVLTGPGAIQFTAGTLTLVNDAIPNLQMVGGTITLSTNFQSGTITNLTLAGSMLSGNYTVTGTFNCGNGLSSGSLLVAAGGMMNWAGGGMSGPLTVSTNGALNIGGNLVSLFTPLTNQGVVNWQSGEMDVYNNGGSSLGAVWNQAGGLWDMQSDQAMLGLLGGEQFNNAGTVLKSAGTGTSTWGVPLLNSGTVAIPQGTLALNRGFTNIGSTTLNFGISGTASYGKISASGTVPLGGTVNASLLGGFVPALSNSFSLITYGSQTGLFTNVIFPPIGTWQTNYGATAFSLTVTRISKLAFTVTPSDTNAGAILAPVVVQVEDQNGNPIATNGVSVTMTLASGTGPLNGTVTRTTDATGKAVFDDLSLNTVGFDALQASASAAALQPATSGLFVISPAPPAQMVLITPISSMQPSSTAFFPSPSLQLLDQFGNISPSLIPITACVSSGGGGALGGETNTAAYNISGSALFSDLRYNLASPYVPENVVVYFTAPGIPSVTNPPVLVTFVFSQIVLQDKNSVIEINPTNEQGMFSWTVDGTNQIFQHWFWLGVGSTVPQASVDHLGTPWGVAYTSSNAVLNYFAQGMRVQLGFTLQGGSPGSLASDLAENISIQNITNTPMNLHLFAYSDFDLGNNYLSDEVSLPAAGTMVQQGKGITMTETVQAPAPSYWEASFYAITVDDLDGDSPVMLSDSFIPQAPGDQTYAWQWDIIAGVGQTVAINLTKSIRPTPIQLNIALSAGNVVISWPTNGATGFQLRSANTPSAGNGWSTVTNMTEVVGEQYRVTLPHSFSAQFYRLQK